MHDTCEEDKDVELKYLEVGALTGTRAQQHNEQDNP